jgi:hypothetical protein
MTGIYANDATALANLLRLTRRQMAEVELSHRTPEGGFAYNECETRACSWCVRTRHLLVELQTAIVELEKRGEL